MISVKDAEYSGCLPVGRMYRNVEHIYGIWHERRCITVHKLANDLGSLLVYAINLTPDGICDRLCQNFCLVC